MKKNFIYKGDCIKVMQDKIANKSIHTVFADPPYNLSGKIYQIQKIQLEVLSIKSMKTGIHLN